MGPYVRKLRRAEGRHAERPGAGVPLRRRRSRRLGGPGQWALALPANYVAGLQVIVRSLFDRHKPRCRRRPRRPCGCDQRPDWRAPLPGDRADPAAPAGWTTDASRRRARAATTRCCSAAPRRAESRSGEQARAAGVAIVTTYGMSETCGGCVYDGDAARRGRRRPRRRRPDQARRSGAVRRLRRPSRPDRRGAAGRLADHAPTSAELDADGLLDRARASRRCGGVGRRQRADCRRRGGRADLSRASPAARSWALPDAGVGRGGLRGGRGSSAAERPGDARRGP